MTSRDGRDFWLEQGEPGYSIGRNGGKTRAADHGRSPERYDASRDRWIDEAPTRVGPPIWESDENPWFSERPRSWDQASHTNLGESPPGPAPTRSQVATSRISSGSFVGMVWLTTGLGLCADGLAVTLAWRNSPFALPLFWAAVIVPFAVFAVVLTACRPSPAVRQFTVALVGLYPSVVYRMSSPFVLGAYDEHLHQQTLNNLLHGSGLFAPNPLLPVSPYYPGLELFTGVIIRLSGMPVILAMSLVVYLCRLLLVLAIYQGALAVTKSDRSASLMVLFYAASPQFYFFNSLFAYQTIALTLGVGGVVLLHRAQREEGTDRGRVLAVMANLALLGTVVSHHATSWIVLAFLIVWTIAAQPGRRRVIARSTAIMAISLAAWTALVMHWLVAYMGPIFKGVLQQVELSITAGLGPHLFRDTAGTALPQWERLVIILYAVLCTCAAVSSGWLIVRRAARQGNRMLRFIGLLSMAYPATLAAHYVPTVALYGDRASTFMFLPVALCCAMVLRRSNGRTHRIRSRTPSRAVGLAAAATFAFLGGVTLGTGPAWAYLPGSYLVSADNRTQDPETLAAVDWATKHLHPGSRFVADRVPADLLAGQARLWPVNHPKDGLDPASIYFSVTWTTSLTATIKGLDIQYLYVDDRLSESLPHLGYYIFRGETAAPTRIPLAALTKFSHVSGLTPVYRHGPVTIYSTARIGVAQKVSGFVGDRSTELSPTLSGVLGAVTAGLVALVLMWLRRMRRKKIFVNVGFLGYSLGVIAATIFVGAALFEFRVVPGPAFTLTAAAVALSTVAIYGHQAGWRRPRGIRLVSLVHPLVVLGTLAVAAGIFLGLHAGWLNEVSAVNQVVRAAVGSHG